MTKFLLLTCLLLSACALPEVATPNPERYDALAFPSATPVPTRTEVPTATIGYQATSDAYMQQSEYWQAIANDSALTVVALESQHVNGTMAADQLTQVMDMLTVTSAHETATAIGTVVPITQTHASNMLTHDSSQMTAASDQWTATANVPTVQAALIQNKTDEWAKPVQAGAIIFLTIAVAVFVIALIAFVARQWKKEDMQKQIFPASDTPIVPFVQDTKDENVYKRAIVPCTTVELIQFAAGVCKAGKTLAFNQWEGTQIHKRLDGLRRFFIHQRFAIEAPGKGGELVIVAEGEQFLRECLDGECPPPPFLCLSQNGNLPVHGHEDHSHEDGGGVGETLVGEVVDGDGEFSREN